MDWMESKFFALVRGLLGRERASCVEQTRRSQNNLAVHAGPLARGRPGCVTILPASNPRSLLLPPVRRACHRPSRSPTESSSNLLGLPVQPSCLSSHLTSPYLAADNTLLSPLVDDPRILDLTSAQFCTRRRISWQLLPFTTQSRVGASNF